MIIITHEMRFARTISNRVFYMDEGGIYEQGSPEDIFDHPTREKTRQFIKRLKTLRLSVDTSSIDYLGTVTQLDRFGSDAELSPHTLRNVTLAIEELIFQCIVPAAHEQGTALTIDVVVEYSESDGALMLQIEWGGAPYDPLTNGNELCLAIVKSVVRQAEYRYEGTNKVICSI